MTSCHSHEEAHGAEDHEEETGHHNHEGAFDIDSHQAEMFGIETEVITPGKFTESIRTSGVIEPAASDLYTVTARKSGIFTLAQGIGAGTMVRKGETVGYISPEGMEGGDISKAAAANLASAKKEYERLLPLYKQGLVTASTLNEAERGYREAEALAEGSAPSGRIALTVPEAGTITSLAANSGQFVESGTPVASVSKNTRLTLRADLPARFSSHLPEIVSANIRPENSDSAISLRDYDGKIISSPSGAKAENGYIPVYFSMTGNPASMPGGYAEVYLLGRERDGVITLPLSALVEIQGNRYAYVVYDGHAYEKRLVKTGATDGRNVEIREGVKPGETVVTRGASVVRMAETSAIAPPSHSHNH